MVAYTPIQDTHGEHTSSWYGRLRSRNGGIEKHLRVAQNKNDSRYSYTLRKLMKVETALGEVKDDVGLIANHRVPRNSISMCTVVAVSVITQGIMYICIQHKEYLLSFLT